jgi:hypothetical protein
MLSKYCIITSYFRDELISKYKHNRLSLFNFEITKSYYIFYSWISIIKVEGMLIGMQNVYMEIKWTKRTATLRGKREEEEEETNKSAQWVLTYRFPVSGRMPQDPDA